MFTVGKYSGQDGFNLSSYDSFLHAQSIFSVVIILFSFKDDRGEPICEQSTLATYSTVSPSSKFWLSRKSLTCT